MLVTLLPMVMLVRPVQFWNALLPDAGDAVGDGDARQASCSFECAIPMLVTLSGNDDARQATAD